MKKLSIILLVIALTSCGQNINENVIKTDKQGSEQKKVLSVDNKEVKEKGTKVKTEKKGGNIYTSFSKEHIGKTDKTVLFFAANWCGSCQQAKKELLSSEIPENINIVIVDYDKNTELKKLYQVQHQHSFVALDKDANVIKKWNHSKNIEDIKNELSK